MIETLKHNAVLAHAAKHPKGRYMVCVEGFVPLNGEYNFDGAVKEAQRLGLYEPNFKRTIRILQVVATLPPVGERQVVMAGEAA